MPTVSINNQLKQSAASLNNRPCASSCAVLYLMASKS